MLYLLTFLGCAAGFFAFAMVALTFAHILPIAICALLICFVLMLVMLMIPLQLGD